jgi:hypothetical protein
LRLKVQHERSETKVGKKVFRRDSDEIFQIHEYILGEHGIYEQKRKWQREIETNKAMQ